jgi:hypothetical protein
LWHFTGKFTPRGDVGKYSNSDIESWLEWKGEPDALVGALLQSHWLDSDPVYRILVHDWAQHADHATKMALGRSKLTFCEHTRATCVNGVRTPDAQVLTPDAHVMPPEPIPVPEPVPVPVPVPSDDSQVSNGVLEDFGEFLAAAMSLNFPASGVDWKIAKSIWRLLEFDQKLEAVHCLKTRKEEFSDPAFLPCPQNYLSKRMWQRPIRPKPQPKANGSAKGLAEGIALFEAAQAAKGGGR